MDQSLDPINNKSVTPSVVELSPHSLWPSCCVNLLFGLVVGARTLGGVVTVVLPPNQMTALGAH